MEKFDTDVIVAGGGPCGLTLAIELGRRGVRCLVIDDKPGTATDPKGNAIQARTMEHFRRLGFSDTVRGLGLPADWPTDIAYFTRYTKYELGRFKLPPSGQARNMVRRMSGSWSTPELPHRCSQMIVERVLYEEALKLPTVTVKHGWTVTGFQDFGDRVEARTEAVDGSAAHDVRGAFLAGCDGARSSVRKSLGIEYEGESGVVRDFMGGRMHAIYMRAPHVYSMISGSPAWMYWTFNKDRRSFMAAVDGKSELVFHTQMKPEEARGEIDERKARSMFAECMGVETDFDIISRNSWTAGFALVSQELQRGRVFIGGDAAHLFTPTGGLGYNTAVDDAVNLGWKLAAVVKGWGGPGLLDSYQAERRPAARRNTSHARRFADSIGNYAAVPELETDTPEGVKSRAEAGVYLEAHARSEFNIPGITFGTRYDGSPVIAADGTEPPPDKPNDYVASACPGGRAPHVWLPGDGGSLFDRFGFEFTLLRFNGADGSGTMEDAAARRGVPLKVVDVPGDEARDLYGSDYAVVRPDQIVAWRGNAPSDDASKLFDIVTGRQA